MSIISRRSTLSFMRLTGVFTLWMLLLFLLALIFNAIGIHLAGGAVEWLQWLDEHRLHFFIWRMCVYTVTAGSWMWARKRLLLRTSESRQITHLMEWIAFPLVLMLELSQWLGQV
ncbi:TPA: hypothetical protein G8N70_003108 [Salmonella enterica]|uniref:Uncharacterized protein n=1 Tax=Salmonella enterica TaxID=28901 RepID=A0A744HE32_SALER|nr:hypothetical protein [Salmonella enterica]HAF4919963.1 hypothetical protein [Salmonella enterica]